MEGLQVGIDSSTRYRIHPDKADEVHNSFANNYVEILIRPSIRSIVRHYVSQNTVTDVYGPKRAEIQAAITEALRERFEEEGFELLSFDIRNVNFTPDYEKSIEAKQIAQQEAERMQFILDKEKSEAERRKIEAEGKKQAAIIEAEGQAEALRLINEQIAQNPNLLTFRYIEKLAPNVNVIMLPGGGQTLQHVRRDQFPHRARPQRVLGRLGRGYRV
jgi:regulator of protease activity HflC (stomatin/prohibitin superfamily)